MGRGRDAEPLTGTVQVLTDSHRTDNSLQWAVDWGLAGQSKLLFAPMAGTLRCHLQGEDAGDGYGVYFSIYNSTGNVTAILAHTVGPPGGVCYPYGANVDTPVLQGAFIGVGDNTGNSTGDHIHFQLNAGNNTAGALISAPFTMSDHEPAGPNLISFDQSSV